MVVWRLFYCFFCVFIFSCSRNTWLCGDTFGTFQYNCRESLVQEIHGCVETILLKQMSFYLIVQEIHGCVETILLAHLSPHSLLLFKKYMVVWRPYVLMNRSYSVSSSCSRNTWLCGDILNLKMEHLWRKRSRNTWLCGDVKYVVCAAVPRIWFKKYMVVWRRYAFFVHSNFMQFVFKKYMVVFNAKPQTIFSSRKFVQNGKN